MLGFLQEMGTAITALEATMEAAMATGGVVQPMVDVAVDLYDNQLSGWKSEALGDGRRAISEIMDTMSEVKQREQQPMVDAAANEVVKQPMKDAVATRKKNSWDTKRKNTQKTRKRQMESARGSEGI